MGSWLRTHFHTFVYPGLVSLFAAIQNSSDRYQSNNPSVASTSLEVNRKTNSWSFDSITDDFYPSLPSELRRLAWLYEKELPAAKKKTEVASSSYYNFNYTSHVLFVHWDELSIDKIFSGECFDGGRGALNFDILRETLKSAESKRRVMGASRLLFAGRDVWLLHVMAQKRGMDSLFIPEISRRVAGAPKDILISFLKSRGFTGDELLVDTGFVGSIPKAINAATGGNLKFVLMSQTEIFGRESESMEAGWRAGNSKEDIKAKKRPQQLFPQRAAARNEALQTEYLPKYWASGTVKMIDDKEQVIQYLANITEFVKAAVLTSCVWRGAKFGIDNKGKHLLAPPKPPKPEYLGKKSVSTFW